MTEYTINPENWVNDELTVKVSKDGTVFEMHGYRFRVEVSSMLVDTGHSYVPVESREEADVIEYAVFSDDGEWTEEFPMCKGMYWPSVFQHDEYEFNSDNAYSRRADEPWKAAAKVLANTI